MEAIPKLEQLNGWKLYPIQYHVSRNHWTYFSFNILQRFFYQSLADTKFFLIKIKIHFFVMEMIVQQKVYEL